MLSPRWSKVARDLWINRTRTALVVISVAVGIFTLGATLISRTVLWQGMSEAYTAINPASGFLSIDSFDDQLLRAVGRMPGVRDVEGRRVITVRAQVGSDEWRNLQLLAVSDYANMRIDKISPVGAIWPPPRREVLVERASLSFMKAKIGDEVVVETMSGKQRKLRIAGLAYDARQLSAAINGTAYGYVNFDTLEWLGEPHSFNELAVVVDGDTHDREHVRQVINSVVDKVESSGSQVHYNVIPDVPGQHPAASIMEPIVLVLGVLGLLSLLLSGALVINTFSALLAQQVRQVGVMKAIGARTNQIMGMYLSMMLVLGVLALVLALPLGLLGARVFAGFVAGILNLDIAVAYVPLPVLALQVVAGLLLPALAALYPIIAGTRITVREAIGDYGLGKGQQTGQIAHRLLTWGRGLSRPLLLSLRNTFRRTGRLILTLSILTLSGAMFIGVFSVRMSLLQTLDNTFQTIGFDAVADLASAADIDRITYEGLQVPGVVAIENGSSTGVRRVRADGSETENIILDAPLAQSRMLRPRIIEGRWLLADDENALVIDTDLMRNNPDIAIGSEVKLRIHGRETTWHVVGVVQSAMTNVPPIPRAYANYAYFAHLIGPLGSTTRITIATERHDAASQLQVAKALEAHFKVTGFNVSSIRTASEIRTGMSMVFDIVVIALLIMAVMIAVVGSIGLMGTMGLNVLERTREIGVMRAIGASDATILWLFIFEGVFIGLLSWVLGTALALPLGRLLSIAVGLSFLRSPLNHVFPPSGVMIWLVLVIILAALASFLPARAASKISVREVLAYE